MPTPARHLLALAVLGVTILAGWYQSPAFAADDRSSIRLLSNEAADRCIQEEACLRDLFLKATLGDGAATPLLRSATKSYVASFAGDRIPADLLSAIDVMMKEIDLLAKAAGADLDLAEPGGEVINLVILISDDFSRDRERSFKQLLTDVFADNPAIYNDLAGSAPPVCRTRLFADRWAAIEGALALADSDVPRPTLQRCLHRLTLNMLGLHHPLPEDVDSVLNPVSARTAWTSIDFLLLKLLHDPLVRPGMTSAELTAVFPELYGRLRGSSS